jgi:hypothetical protein
MERLTAMTDRFPMDVGQQDMAPRVMRDSVANRFDYLTHTASMQPAEGQGAISGAVHRTGLTHHRPGAIGGPGADRGVDC